MSVRNFNCLTCSFGSCMEFSKFHVKADDEDDSEELCQSKVTTDAISDTVADTNKIKSELFPVCHFCLESSANMENVENHYGICASADEYIKFDSVKSQKDFRVKLVFGEDEYLICLQCRKLFTTVQLLQNHISIIHESEKSIKVEIKDEMLHLDSTQDDKCESITNDSDDWPENTTFLCTDVKSSNEYDESTSSMAFTSYQCEHCTYSNNLLSKLRRHITMLHMPLKTTNKKVSRHKSFPTVSYRCQHCAECSESKDDREKHRVWHNNEEIMKCTICQKNILGRKLYRVHKLRHGSQEKNQLCTHCGKLVTKRVLARHFLNCGTQQTTPYQCNVCDKKFNILEKLQQHKHIHVNGRIHQCLQCTSAFKQYRHLRDHVRVHDANITHCKGCNINFDDITAYKEHQVQHVNGRKLLIDLSVTEVNNQNLQCTICNELFLSFEAARAHWEKEHERHLENKKCYKCKNEILFNSHKCPVPGNSVVNAEKYQLIQRMKLKEKVECPDCKKIFSRGSLHNHIKTIHRKEKNFRCSYCPAKFARRDWQITHERTHTGEKPYKCGICSRGFAQYTDCKRHEKRHDTDRWNVTINARMCKQTN